VGFYKTTMPWWLRVPALIGALGLLAPGTATDIVGLVILAVIHVMQTIRAKREASSTAQSKTQTGESEP
jgi:UPF0716 family protein affecting phage T7 exclusion